METSIEFIGHGDPTEFSLEVGRTVRKIKQNPAVRSEPIILYNHCVNKMGNGYHYTALIIYEKSE